MDRAVSQLERARDYAAKQQIANVEFRPGSVYTLPFADQTFDAVFSHALLEHLADPLAALNQMKRVLKPGGVAGVCCPDWSGFLVAPSTPALVEAIEF
jgi:ubiquinone/menaquinone biosynthesis C-methylase UbiE